MPFIVRHAGGTINREKIGADAMTARKRLRGKGKHKADYIWLNGVWLGIKLALQMEYSRSARRKMELGGVQHVQMVRMGANPQGTRN